MYTRNFGKQKYTPPPGYDGTAFGGILSTKHHEPTELIRSDERLPEPVEVQINDESHREERILKVYNMKFILPETGGMGTAVFTVLGISFIGGAMILAFGCVRKKENL